MWMEKGQKAPHLYLGVFAPFVLKMLFNKLTCFILDNIHKNFQF